MTKDESRLRLADYLSYRGQQCRDAGRFIVSLGCFGLLLGVCFASDEPLEARGVDVWSMPRVRGAPTRPVVAVARCLSI